jgi:chromosome segregation ATPase
MNGVTRMQEAQAQVLAAEVVIATQQFQALTDQYDAAKAEGRKIDELIKQTGSSLAAKHRESEPLWERRAIIDRTRGALDKAFAEQEFPSEEQGEQYAEKRAALTDQWHQLTTTITQFSGDIARLEEELRRLNFARSRSVMAVKDLGNAIADRQARRF